MSSSHEIIVNACINNIQGHREADRNRVASMVRRIVAEHQSINELSAVSEDGRFAADPDYRRACDAIYAVVYEIQTGMHPY